MKFLIRFLRVSFKKPYENDAESIDPELEPMTARAAIKKQRRRLIFEFPTPRLNYVRSDAQLSTPGLHASPNCMGTRMQGNDNE